MRTSRREIDELLARKAAWIESRLARSPAREPLALVDGAQLPFLGEPLSLRLVIANRGRVWRDGGELVVELPEPSEPSIRASVVRWYRARAAEHFVAVAGHWAKISGFSPRGVLQRDQKRRWGSCGADGTIRLNWRLMTFAPEVIEYVIVHELCHLAHKNHGPAFWAEVRRLLPDQQERRRRLGAVAEVAF
jgi:predicted metal-dependent hydrolase